VDDPLREIDVERFFEDYFDDGASRRPAPPDLPELPPLENTLTESPDLYDHLLWQLRMTEADEATLEIGEAIVQNLDEDGLLRVPLEDVAAMGPWPLETVETVLALVQSLDPPGVAARSLTECLRIQLRVLGLEGSPADVMVRDHMKQLQGHQYPEIARQMGLSADEVAHHLEIIRGLSPRPGYRYGGKRSDYILPDVFVVKEGEEYKIVLNDDGSAEAPDQPHLPAHARPEGAGVGGDAGLRQGQAAQRAVAAEERRPAAADDLQGRGLDRAPPARLPRPRHLPPAAPRAARRGERHRHARVDGVRVVANKYMHTPRGVYEMRFFFHSGITSTMGESVSSVTIKDRIRKMIEEEDASRPLSDSRIADVLGGEGLPLARRTVAKYREELRIPPSNLRKTVH
jgi:RNA polymerase sigma-54 factor